MPKNDLNFLAQKLVNVSENDPGFHVIFSYRRFAFLKAEYCTAFCFGSNCLGIIQVTKTDIITLVRIVDLDKLNLVKPAYGGLVLGLRQFSVLPQLP